MWWVERDLQIEHYQSYCRGKGNCRPRLYLRVSLLQSVFDDELKEANVFVTTFDNTERMPYVAHTKIYEYLAMKRPIMGPNLEIVKEHAPYGLLNL